MKAAAKIGTLASLLLVGPPAFAATAKAESRAEPKDTAGTYLRKVYTEARKKYRDAVLVSINGRTPADGVSRCDRKFPSQNGWRYTFYSEKNEKFLIMFECRGVTEGPHVLLRSRGSSTATLPISGKFIDSDMTLYAIKRGGVSLDPRDHNASGKRPFTLVLSRLEDGRFTDHPAIWKVVIGKKSFIVDAARNEVFDPERYGVSLSAVDISTGPLDAEVLRERPKKESVYTAKTDIQRVLTYAREHYPGSSLMAIEGLVDSWGASPCTGPGDGWSYYFYYPRTRGFESVYSCNNEVGIGTTRYIPVDLNLHEVIKGEFVDSDRVIDVLLVVQPEVMNEGLGRSFTRTGTLRLRNYRASPFSSPELWKTKLLWEFTLGRTLFRHDAITGRLIDAQDH
ncbi:MAG: hypothetical protein ABII00_16650 [Elusimicrobiota bacterium]